MKNILLITLAISASFLSGCMTDFPSAREEAAKRAAMPVFMLPRTVPAGDFNLQAYERVHKKFDTAVLYIEGDGVPYATPMIPSLVTTPTDPVAVRLAAQDGSANVIYLGRPCQFSKGLREGKEGKACPEKYWTTHRFAPEIIAAYKAALDNIKAYHDVTGFHIVGYGGGGTIAALLAVERSDILTLRTVAGNLDPKTSAWTRNITEPTGSLNPINYASKLVNMPQRHFIGKLDQVIAPAVYNSYAQALGNSPCLSVTMVDQADHQLGWVEQWNKLKDLPAVCNKPVELPPAKFDPATLDGDKGLGVK